MLLCFATSHFTWAPYSSSNISCSAIFGHLRTLFIFCLSHNKFTPNHNSPSAVFFEELCKSFYWHLTLSVLEYPQCHCVHVHPPRLAAWRTGHKPSSLRCSLRSPSSRFLLWENSRLSLPSQGSTKYPTWALLSVFLLHLKLHVQCYWGLLLFFITDALQCSWENEGEEQLKSLAVRPVSPGVREMRAVLGRWGGFLAHQSEKPEVQGKWSKARRTRGSPG